MNCCVGCNFSMKVHRSGTLFGAELCLGMHKCVCAFREIEGSESSLGDDGTPAPSASTTTAIGVGDDSTSTASPGAASDTSETPFSTSQSAAEKIFVPPSSLVVRWTETQRRGLYIFRGSLLSIRSCYFLSRPQDRKKGVG